DRALSHIDDARHGMARDAWGPYRSTQQQVTAAERRSVVATETLGQPRRTIDGVRQATLARRATMSDHSVGYATTQGVEQFTESVDEVFAGLANSDTPVR